MTAERFVYPAAISIKYIILALMLGLLKFNKYIFNYIHFNLNGDQFPYIPIKNVAAYHKCLLWAGGIL